MEKEPKAVSYEAVHLKLLEDILAEIKLMRKADTVPETNSRKYEVIIRFKGEEGRLWLISRSISGWLVHPLDLPKLQHDEPDPFPDKVFDIVLRNGNKEWKLFLNENGEYWAGKT